MNDVGSRRPLTMPGSVRLCVTVAALLAAGVAAADVTPPSAQALLQAADRARGGTGRGLSWRISLETTENGEVSRRAFRVRTRGNHALVEGLEPPRTKGEILLWSERTLWFSKPGLRKPVSVSARQRLSGLASNGDIAAAAYARDYTGTVTGVEDVGGGPAWVLDLRAVAPSATYERIRYWVSQSRQVAVRADFLGADGKVIKTAAFEYGNEVERDGVRGPLISAMTLTDVATGDRTTMRYAEPRFDELPESLFNVNNLAR